METTTTTSQMQLNQEEEQEQQQRQWQQQLLLLHATAAKRVGHRAHCRQIECPIFDFSSLCSKCPIYNQRRAVLHVAAMYRILLFHMKLSALSTADEPV